MRQFLNPDSLGLRLEYNRESTNRWEVRVGKTLVAAYPTAAEAKNRLHYERFSFFHLDSLETEDSQ